MPDSHKNFIITAVATAPSPATSGTSLVVSAGYGANFPAAPFNLTVWPPEVEPSLTNAEIVRVTAISTDTLTIARAQESTSARSIQAGDPIALTITAKALTDLDSALADKVPTTRTVNGHALSGDVTVTRADLSLATTDRPEFANVRVTHSTLTYAGSVSLDFDGDGFQTVTLTGNITFTTSNLAAGRSKTIRIIGDSNERDLTFPAGWTFVGAESPATLAVDKIAILTLTSFGTTDADVVAAYAAQP